MNFKFAKLEEATADVAENANEKKEQSAAQIYGFFIDSWPALHGLWA